MPGLPRDMIYVGLSGAVVGLDRTTGSERWRTKLKGNHLVVLMTDGERLYASTSGQAFCLDPTTGAILWRNPLKGLGYGISTLLGPGGEGGGSSIPAAAGAERARGNGGASS